MTTGYAMVTNSATLSPLTASGGRSRFFSSVVPSPVFASTPAPNSSRPRNYTACRTRAGVLALLFLASAAGCTHHAARRAQVQTKLAEESRALTTAVVDTLQLAPAD